MSTLAELREQFFTETWLREVMLEAAIQPPVPVWRWVEPEKWPLAVYFAARYLEAGNVVELNVSHTLFQRSTAAHVRRLGGVLPLDVVTSAVRDAYAVEAVYAVTRVLAFQLTGSFVAPPAEALEPHRLTNGLFASVPAAESRAHELIDARAGLSVARVGLGGLTAAPASSCAG